jgi:hypothetical protein
MIRALHSNAEITFDMTPSSSASLDDTDAILAIHRANMKEKKKADKAKADKVKADKAKGSNLWGKAPAPSTRIGMDLESLPDPFAKFEFDDEDMDMF